MKPGIVYYLSAGHENAVAFGLPVFSPEGDKRSLNMPPPTLDYLDYKYYFGDYHLK
jgi:hypothetical protein